MRRWILMVSMLAVAVASVAGPLLPLDPVPDSPVEVILRDEAAAIVLQGHEGRAQAPFDRCFWFDEEDAASLGAFTGARAGRTVTIEVDGRTWSPLVAEAVTGGLCIDLSR